jgi:osmotically inducible protein OsmC
MGISKGTAQWTGGLKDGKGVMRPAHAGEASFGVASRFEGQPNSNPEELIGAALAGCFSMALTAALERNGFKAESVQTASDVHLDKLSDGWNITAIDLTSEAKVSGIDADRFQQIAEETKRTCPVSKALAGTKISLKAKLA